MGDDKEYAKIKPLMPTSVKKKYKQLFIRLFRAENLPKMDTMFGTIDAYAVLKFGKFKLKTKVIKMEGGKVDWMQEMLVPVEIPIKDDKLTLQVWDQDNLVDELCCSVLFSLKSFLKHDITLDPSAQGMVKWVNLYGAHAGY